MEEKLSHLGLGMPSVDDNVKHLAVFCVVGKLQTILPITYTRKLVSLPFRKKEKKNSNEEQKQRKKGVEV